MKEKVRGEVRVKRKEEVANEDSANRHAPNPPILNPSCPLLHFYFSFPLKRGSGVLP